MAEKSKTPTLAVTLDWSKLLGFDQVRETARGELSLLDSHFAKLGSKACTIART